MESASVTISKTKESDEKGNDSVQQVETPVSLSAAGDTTGTGIAKTMSDDQPSTSATDSPETTDKPGSCEAGNEPTSLMKPVCLIVLGMAGSGKTSFVQRLSSHLYSIKNNPYVINLDPAVSEIPYPANVDIRDTVKYKEVMKQYQLGPNGAIMTCLNLFATRFDQILKLIEKRKSEYEYVVFDTPGQIEVFTWSASGNIITEALVSITFIIKILYSQRYLLFENN